jgi:hypothetical protein
MQSTYCTAADPLAAANVLCMVFRLSRLQTAPWSRNPLRHDLLLDCAVTQAPKQLPKAE